MSSISDVLGSIVTTTLLFLVMPGNIGKISADTIASWPPPNYDNPETRGWYPIYAGILYGITTAVAGARLWLRAYKKQAGGLGVDDVAPTLPLTMNMALC